MSDMSKVPPGVPLSAESPLVGVAWLSEQFAHLPSEPGAAASLRVVDLRWNAKGPSGEDRYRQGHIPGAAFVDLDKDLARPGGPGRHPFPTVEQFASVLGRIGVGAGTHVVVYDDGPGAIAARLWFMLRVHGHLRASVLEGGLAAWRAAGLPMAAGESEVAPTTPPLLSLDASRLVDQVELRTLLREQGKNATGALVLDARARERYRGEVEPIDAKPGHIPGVVNAPFAENLRGPDDLRFKPAPELRRLYESLGADRASQVVVTCGSGVTACHDALAIELAGLAPARLYVGSFSDWIATPGAPIALGTAPGSLEG